MFKKKDGDGAAATGDTAENDLSAPPLKPFSKHGSHTPAKPPSRPVNYHPEVPRRVADIPGMTRRSEPRRTGADSEARRLVVGREITLSGEITSCEKLVVEGHVEVTIPDSRVLEVTSTGLFRGRAEVDEADIAGRFEGDLIARDRLAVRAGGKVSGTIRYGRIVIESGGEISGDMRTLDAPAADDETKT
jgi:cytoskeletal protein CcmA (bactofilin family)